MGLESLYPFECIKVENHEHKVMGLFNVMREDGKAKGYTPIIIIEDEHGLMEENVVFAEEDYSSFQGFVNACLDEYPKFDVKSFFEDRKKVYKEEGNLEDKEGDTIYEESNSVYLGEKGENIYLAKIPTDKAYEVLAYVPMGGYNDCPDNIVHVAIAKHWFEKYGAYPICVGSDTIQFKLEDPIVDEKELEVIAMEQYLYCGDIVWQGVESVKNLQSSLGNSKVWYFWWE
ncbi:DUF4253 domain-containing protein [Clostridium paraputrificum]|uniref:DUF4253 domain-containing protein n=1 Tax=Clostridium TaxID=1485 RepID=UPI003D328CE1